jgi:hypothetical protein
LKKKNTPPPELKGLFCELKTAWNPTRQDKLTGKKGVNHRLRRACPFAVVVRQWAHTGRGTVSKVRGLMIRVVLCFCGRRKRLLFGSSFHFLKVKQFLSCCRNRAPSLFFSLIPRRDATDLGAGHHRTEVAAACTADPFPALPPQIRAHGTACRGNTGLASHRGRLPRLGADRTIAHTWRFSLGCSWQRPVGIEVRQVVRVKWLRVLPSRTITPILFDSCRMPRDDS